MQKTILSTADVARLFNVTETTVKRWADEGTLKCHKTPGGHRKFDVKYVVDFAERNDIEPSGTLSLGPSDVLGKATEVALLARDYPALAGIFVEKALTPDDLDLYVFLSYLYEHKMHLWEIYDHVVRPGMAEIGARWAGERIDVSDEHQASAETLQALAKLQAEILVKPPVGAQALFACIGDEQHEIGLRCASYLFQSEGWGVHYLGGRTPIEAIERRVERLKPLAVCVSLSVCGAGESAERSLARLAAVTSKQKCMLIVGGAGASAGLLERGVCDAVVFSTRELIGLMSHMLDGKQNGTPRPA